MTILPLLPPIRGQYRENFALSEVTWFRVGGAAEILFKPADADDLAQFLKAKPKDIPHIVIGVGSNLLVRDGGVAGVVIRLGREFAKIELSKPSPSGRGQGEGPKHKIPMPEKFLAFSRALRKNATDAEKLLWDILRNRQFFGIKFRRQHPLPPYIADFFSEELKLVIELDGGQHAEQQGKDAVRSAFLNDQGYCVLRFWNNQILDNLEGVFERIAEFLPHPNPLPEGEGMIVAGAGALDMHVAEFAAGQGIGGLEFLSGVPGTIGGALFMNAGAYESEIKDVLVWAEGIDVAGNLQRLTAAECGFTYRHSSVPEGFVFTRACLKGFAKPEAEIRARMEEISEQRKSTQPVRSRTGGSTFANPPGKKAWQLIDEAGGRGLTKGDAKISEMHCNFLINTGNATAKDLEDLGEEVRAKVKAKSGIDLRWEIQRIGKR